MKTTCIDCKEVMIDPVMASDGTPITFPDAELICARCARKKHRKVTVHK